MNKVIVITGSTDGIGKLAAIKLAKEGHTMLLHGRSEAKLANVVAEVKNISGNNNVDGVVADLSDLNEVKKMANRLKSDLLHIDVLINNAGVFKAPNPITKEGIDIRMVVNYFAPYILTDALLPLLKNGTNPRVINLSSAAQSSVSMDVLFGKSQASAQEAYA